jgi:hypothetical protein
MVKKKNGTLRVDNEICTFVLLACLSIFYHIDLINLIKFLQCDQNNRNI